MKKIAIVLALSLGLISCSDKESASTASSSSVKTLTTIEDYAEEVVRNLEEMAYVIESSTPANSALQAKKIKEIMARIDKTGKEAEAKFGKKAFDDIAVKAGYKSRAQAAMQRILQWAMANNHNHEQYAPEFNEAMNAL